MQRQFAAVTLKSSKHRGWRCWEFPEISLLLGKCLMNPKGNHSLSEQLPASCKDKWLHRMPSAPIAAGSNTGTKLATARNPEHLLGHLTYCIWFAGRKLCLRTRCSTSEQGEQAEPPFAHQLDGEALAAWTGVYSSIQRKTQASALRKDKDDLNMT